MRKATIISSHLALFANFFLLVIKLVAGIYSGSIALISDAINSFTDVLASIALIVCVKVSHKKADFTHPFGHHRAEPIGGLIVAVIAALLGFEVIKESTLSLFADTVLMINAWVYSVVIITILVKITLFLIFSYFSKMNKAPSIRALAMDSKNDIIVSLMVILNFVLYTYDVKYVDGVVGIIIGFWIIYNGLKIGIENIDYLMGRRPSEEIINHVRKSALSIKGVKGVNDIFAHYVGPFVHVEVHIEVDKKLILAKTHDIAKKVQEKVEEMGTVDRAFIHVDPI